MAKCLPFMHNYRAVGVHVCVCVCLTRLHGGGLLVSLEVR